MTLASARLAYLAKKNPPHLDQFATILASTIDEQHGILFLARISQSLAILQDFSGRTLQDLERFNMEKQTRLERTIREFGDAEPTCLLGLTDIRLVTGTTPYVFAIHEPDDSYGIGFDEALYDIFAILTIAALAAFRNKDLEIYKRFCFHVFQLYFMGPHPSIIADFEQLAMMYAGSAPPIRAMIGDVRDTCTRFILAHEVAHIALGHFKRHKAAVYNFQPGVQPTEISGFPDYACEFEADAWGADLLLRLAGGNMRSEIAAIQTPPLLMTFLAHIGTLGEGMAILSDRLRACHPPEEERRAKLRAAAEGNSRERRRRPDLVLQIGDFLAQMDSPLNPEARASLRASLKKSF
jgi:hypothetical protein